MKDGRTISAGQSFPIARAVGESRYCFPSSKETSSNTKGVRLLCAGWEKCLPGYHVERTEFQCNLMELVVEGQGTIRIQGKSHEIFPGVVFCYGMDSPHEMWASVENPMTKYFAAFELHNSLDTIADFNISKDIRWTRDLSTMRVLFDELIREGQQDGDLHQHITAAYLNLILLKAAEALPDDRIPRRSEGKGRDVFERALLCIETGFCDITSLDELGAKVGVDANYICRVFKRFGKETPIQCLSRHKLNYAAELLLSQSMSIAEIAGVVGYADQFYFSKVFKKRFGSSPRDFRTNG